MSQQSVLTLNTKAYNPRGVASGIATWVDPAGSSGAAISAVTESVRGPSGQGVTRVQFKLTLPKLASADSACACAGSVLGTAIGTFDIVIPGVFTPTEREDLQLRLTGLAASAIFVNAVKDLEGAW